MTKRMVVVYHECEAWGCDEQVPKGVSLCEEYLIDAYAYTEILESMN